jgi:hypothetical protein
MNPGANGKIIMTATKDLMHRWEETKADWKDAKGREFEEKYLLDLVSAVERTATILDEMEGIIRKMRSQCE